MHPFIVQKSRQSSNVKVKGQRSRSSGTKKKEKVRHFVRESSSGARSSASSTPVGKSAHAVQVKAVNISRLSRDSRI